MWAGENKFQVTKGRRGSNTLVYFVGNEKQEYFLYGFRMEALLGPLPHSLP